MPDAPGYYWAKLKTPSGGDVYNVSTIDGVHIGRARIEPEVCSDGDESWASLDWEIVEVHINGHDPKDDEYFSVSVFGIPVTQWPLDFFWGPKVDARPPA